MERELKKLHEGSFTGNIEFILNHKEGIVCNMNVVLKKSVMMPKEKI